MTTLLALLRWPLLGILRRLDERRARQEDRDEELWEALGVAAWDDHERFDGGEE